MNKSKSKNYFQCCQIETTLDTFILGDFFSFINHRFSHEYSLHGADFIPFKSAIVAATSKRKDFDLRSGVVVFGRIFLSYFLKVLWRE